MTEVLSNRMTAEELRRKAEETAIVLLPVALTEQHGRHLAHQAAFLAPWRWGLKLDTPRSPSGPPPVCTGPSRDRQFANDCIAWARIATSDDQREQFLVPPRPKASHCHSFRLCTVRLLQFATAFSAAAAGAAAYRETHAAGNRANPKAIRLRHFARVA
jgi:hypothetical protein